MTFGNTMRTKLIIKADTFVLYWPLFFGVNVEVEQRLQMVAQFPFRMIIQTPLVGCK